MEIPDILRSGNHELIRRWRLQQSLGRTWQRRPDLLEKRQMNAEETELLKAYIAAHEQQTNEEQ
jgi:tRNA (guanine37-N1)-methyltransferase